MPFAKKLEGSDVIRDSALTQAINTTSSAIGAFGLSLRHHAMTTDEKDVLASDIREMSKTLNMLISKRNKLRGV